MTLAITSVPAHGPSRMAARTPPRRWPDVPPATWKLNIWAAKMNAAMTPMSGTDRSSIVRLVSRTAIAEHDRDDHPEHAARPGRSGSGRARAARVRGRRSAGGGGDGEEGMGRGLPATAGGRGYGRMLVARRRCCKTLQQRSRSTLYFAPMARPDHPPMPRRSSAPQSRGPTSASGSVRAGCAGRPSGARWSRCCSRATATSPARELVDRCRAAGSRRRRRRPCTGRSTCSRSWASCGTRTGRTAARSSTSCPTTDHGHLHCPAATGRGRSTPDEAGRARPGARAGARVPRATSRTCRSSGLCRDCASRPRLTWRA